MTKDQDLILNALCFDEPYSTDELADELHISDDRVLSALRYLESKELVERTTKTIPHGWVKK